MFSTTKGSIKPNLLPILNIFRLFLKIWVYFQAFKNSYPQERSGKHGKSLNLKVLGKKMEPILKLDLGFGSRYRNLVSVIHYLKYVHINPLSIDVRRINLFKQTTQKEKYRKIESNKIVGTLILMSNVLHHELIC